jgi:hypothetical protein
VNTPSREDLLGYVLGALDAPEHEQITNCFQAHPELEIELNRLHARLEPLDFCRSAPADFPVGLARRTCEAVARASRAGDPDPRARSAADPATDRPSPPFPPPSTPRSLVPAVRSAMMVGCAALLGAWLGPIAYRLVLPDAQCSLSSLAAAAPAEPLDFQSALDPSESISSTLQERESLGISPRRTSLAQTEAQAPRGGLPAPSTNRRTWNTQFISN